MKDEAKKFSELERYTENPFMKGHKMELQLQSKGILVGAATKKIMDVETGEINDLKLIGSVKKVDPEAFVKVYKSRISTIFELSRPATKVLSYIMENLKPNEDTIYIYLPDLMEYAGWDTKPSAYKALLDIINKKILHLSTKPNIYYINPAIIFNGDRIAFVDAYYRSDSKKMVDPLRPPQENVLFLPETEEI